jgi:signal transduction histidine kinase/CheY-like chemotaxis protein
VETGTGVLVIISGALSPAFGVEEIERLGGYAAAITIALDRARTSERVLRSEMELSEARDSAQAASRAKSEFLSRMSHELRTPLTAMMGFAELLGLDDLSDQQRRYVGTIIKAGDHLLALINDVLDIARIEEGRLSMSLEPIAVADVVNEVVDLARPMADDRGILVRVKPGANNPYVFADHQRLKQVLLNLVSNAIKYNNEHGSVQLVVEPEDGMVRIAVVDTGRGLREDEIARLFAPFERLSASRTEIEGTGLGLALSKSLTEAMLGRIGVESTPGQGSTFWVELPVAEAHLLPADGSPVAGQAASDADTEPQVLLYVEDTVSNIRLLEGIVSRRPHITLIPAMQGSMAMELARQHRPDLILLDVHLPDIEGADLLQQFRTDPATAEVPVIMLSADATQRQIDRFLAAGAVAYLTKPIRVSLLLAELDRHLAPAKARV